MAVDTNNILTFAQGFVSGAPANTGDPGAPTTSPTAPSSPWYDFGAITQDGLVENPNESRQELYRWGSIAPYAVIITKEDKTFQVKFLEKNPYVLGLYYRVATPTPTGASANEVQTVTISGTPTGGTFTLDFSGQPTVDIAYNAAASVVQTALQNLSSIGAGNVAVTGSAGGPYTVTFQGTLAAANLPQMVAVSNLTGGTSPSVAVATTTQGSAGSLLTITDDTTGQRDVRAFCFDLVNGTNHERYYIPNGEVSARGNVVSKFDTPTTYDVTITAYPDASGVAVKRYFLLDAIRLGE